MEIPGRHYSAIVDDCALNRNPEIGVEENLSSFTGEEFYINGDGTGDRAPVVRDSATSENKLVSGRRHEFGIGNT